MPHFGHKKLGTVVRQIVRKRFAKAQSQDSTVFSAKVHASVSVALWRSQHAFVQSGPRRSQDFIISTFFQPRTLAEVLRQEARAVAKFIIAALDLTVHSGSAVLQGRPGICTKGTSFICIARLRPL